MTITRHLWEIDHPYYGVDGTIVFAESFADLRETVDFYDARRNHVYRWDWVPADEADEDQRDQFTVYTIQPRKDGFTSFTCPVTRDQEDEVLAWLRGPRVLGALRAMWEPLLDDQPQTGN
jgi:hypothetical protein